MGLASSAAAAEPLPFFAKWSLGASSDKYDVTALGDNNKVYVSGLSDASGDFSGFADDATTQTYAAAVDGQPRKFYLYPDLVNAASVYWYGTILVDFKVDGDVGGPINVSASWNAASAILKSTA
jgi:hypothetical protein